MTKVPVVELRVTIDGQEVFGLFDGDRALGCATSERDLVLGVITEALAMICGVRPRNDNDVAASVQRKTPAHVLSIVKE